MNGLKMIMMKMKKKNNERMDKWIEALINIAGKEHLSILYAFLINIYNGMIFVDVIKKKMWKNMIKKEKWYRIDKI